MEKESVFTQYYGEGIDENKINSRMAVLFAAIAAFMPIAVRFTRMAIFSLIEGKSDLTQLQNNGIELLISCVFNVIIILVLLTGGFVVTRKLVGALRFTGIFSLSSTIVGVISSAANVVYSVLEMYVSPQVISVIELVRMIITDTLTVVLFYFLYKSFEERKTNKAVTRSEYKTLQKRIAISIIAIFAVILAGYVVQISGPYLYEIFNVSFEVINILSQVVGLVQSVLILGIFYLLCSGVRKDKNDAIGCMAAYYLPELFVYPVLQLLRGAVYMLPVNISEFLLSGINIVLSNLSSIAGIVLAFVFLKFFFTVKDENSQI